MRHTSLRSVFALAVIASCSTQTSRTASTSAITGVTSPSHVVVVIEENHGFGEIIGNGSAPYMNSLANRGALFTNSHAIEHPSEPNYLDLFSGSNQGVHDDSCPHTFSSPNLGAALIAAGRSFAGYSEDLPGVGATDCSRGDYWRKHNPWVNFSNLSPSTNQPFTNFPSDSSQLPTISFVIPNQQHDMHDGSIAQADQWLQQHLDAYVNWAQSNDGLLILTWDEDDGSAGNQIVTVFVGPMVNPGRYGESINHFNVLRTLEDLHSLSHSGQSASVSPITDIWRTGTLPDAAASDAATSDFQRTVVFVFGVTQPGQDMFVRGGIDFGYASAHLGRNCNASPYDCAIPIRHRNSRNATTAPLKANDRFLDWLGAEPNQDPRAAGTPMDWTTNAWPPAWGAMRTVAVDGYGVELLNLWGLHYWMLDVDMDCSKTVDGWFELKTYIKNGAGWEPDIHQAGTPYSSNNHFARCGQISRFETGSNAVDTHSF